LTGCWLLVLIARLIISIFEYRMQFAFWIWSMIWQSWIRHTSLGQSMVFEFWIAGIRLCGCCLIYLWYYVINCCKISVSSPVDYFAINPAQLMARFWHILLKYMRCLKNMVLWNVHWKIKSFEKCSSIVWRTNDIFRCPKWYCFSVFATLNCLLIDFPKKLFQFHAINVIRLWKWEFIKIVEISLETNILGNIE
jgi:hypothetical protein